VVPFVRALEAPEDPTCARRSPDIGSPSSFLQQVEALESGVFRSDLPCKFRCKPEAYQVWRGVAWLVWEM